VSAPGAIALVVGVLTWRRLIRTRPGYQRPAIWVQQLIGRSPVIEGPLGRSAGIYPSMERSRFIRLLVAVAPVAEFLDKSWVGRRPVELISSLGRDGALIEQQDFGEIVA
jgi:hypothetical protein